MSVWIDLLGTSKNLFRLGLNGIGLKSTGSRRRS